MNFIELFHIGPQKSGTTWIYQCLYEHPEVAVPPQDSIHYFDIYYFKGYTWIRSHFKHALSNQKLFDPTYSYIRSPLAPERIKNENPNARIALSMRHPLTRAFSHYWHEKKKCRYDFSFKEIIKNYDLFANWMEPGFYASHIERYLEYFSREQILPQVYDYMINNPEEFLRELFTFYGVNPEFTPSVVGKRINVAKPQEHWAQRKAKNTIKRKGKQAIEIIGLGTAVPYAKRLFQSKTSINNGGYNIRQNNMEYLCDEPQALLEDLMDLCIPEIERLEKLLSIDLTDWKSLEYIGC